LWVNLITPQVAARPSLGAAVRGSGGGWIDGQERGLARSNDRLHGLVDHQLARNDLRGGGKGVERRWERAATEKRGRKRRYPMLSVERSGEGGPSQTTTKNKEEEQLEERVESARHG
jgi:hypothetical protein